MTLDGETDAATLASELSSADCTAGGTVVPAESPSPSAEMILMASIPDVFIAFPFGFPGVGVVERPISPSAPDFGDFLPSFQDIVTRNLRVLLDFDAIVDEESVDRANVVVVCARAVFDVQILSIHLINKIMKCMRSRGLASASANRITGSFSSLFTLMSSQGGTLEELIQISFNLLWLPRSISARREFCINLCIVALGLR